MPELPPEIAKMDVTPFGGGCAHVVATAPDGVVTSGTLLHCAPYSERGFRQIIAALAVQREMARG